MEIMLQILGQRSRSLGHAKQRAEWFVARERKALEISNFPMTRATNEAVTARSAGKLIGC